VGVGVVCIRTLFCQSSMVTGQYWHRTRKAAVLCIVSARARSRSLEAVESSTNPFVLGLMGTGLMVVVSKKASDQGASSGKAAPMLARSSGVNVWMDARISALAAPAWRWSRVPSQPLAMLAG
jgi:hypothetical protein